MINVLVVDDNFSYLKKLVNIISLENSKLKVCNFCTDGKEVLDLITNHKDNIDIILLDLKLPTYNGIEILNYIEKNNLSKYKNSIIVISGEMDLMLQMRDNQYLYTYISKISGFEKILKALNELIDIKEKEKKSVEYKIHTELEKLHYNFSYIGTQYLIETLLILYNNDIEVINLKKDVYSIIAKKYKKSINNIKTNIINATNLMYYDCKSEILEQYFGIVSGEKPTPKNIIYTILYNIKNNHY